MTTTEERQNVEIRALRMLRAGDSPKDVAQAVGLTLDEVAKLKRDFPGGPTLGRPGPPPTPPPTPAKACDFAGCRGIATALAGGWAFCPTHLKSHQAEHPTTEPGLPLPRLIGELLEDASAHSRANVRNLGKKIEADIDRLRAAIAEHAQAERAKRQALEARAKAKAEVARLEAELAAAKAKLRGKTPPPAAAVPAADGTHACTKGCGRTFVNAQGRGKHERSCEAAA